MLTQATMVTWGSAMVDAAEYKPCLLDYFGNGRDGASPQRVSWEGIAPPEKASVLSRMWESRQWSLFFCGGAGAPVLARRL